VPSVLKLPVIFVAGNLGLPVVSYRQARNLLVRCLPATYLALITLCTPKACVFWKMWVTLKRAGWLQQMFNVTTSCFPACMQPYLPLVNGFVDDALRDAGPCVMETLHKNVIFAHFCTFLIIRSYCLQDIIKIGWWVLSKPKQCRIRDVCMTENTKFPRFVFPQLVQRH